MKKLIPLMLLAAAIAFSACAHHDNMSSQSYQRSTSTGYSK